jgi:hypothetical protein
MPSPGRTAMLQTRAAVPWVFAPGGAEGTAADAAGELLDIDMRYGVSIKLRPYGISKRKKFCGTAGFMMFKDMGNQ